MRLKLLAVAAALALPIGHAHADTFYTYEAHGAFEADPFSMTQGFALLTGAVTVNGTTLRMLTCMLPDVASPTSPLPRLKE